MTASPSRVAIELLAAGGWPAARAEATRLLQRGGLHHLELAAEIAAEADSRTLVPTTDQLPEQIWSRLARAAHPLAWLPPRLAPLEHGLSRREPGPNNTESCSSPPRIRPEAIPPAPANSPTPELTPAEPHPDALAAFHGIITQSNGRAETAAFLLDTPAASPAALATALQTRVAPLKPPANARHAPPSRITPRDAVLTLLHLAINGGAHDSPAGLRGRLAAWRTLRALTCPDADATFAHTHAAASAATWLTFDTTGLPWFEHVAWDGCLACLNATSPRLTAIAWTDSD